MLYPLTTEINVLLKEEFYPKILCLVVILGKESGEHLVNLVKHCLCASWSGVGPLLFPICAHSLGEHSILLDNDESLTPSLLYFSVELILTLFSSKNLPNVFPSYFHLIGNLASSFPEKTEQSEENFFKFP